MKSSAQEKLKFLASQHDFILKINADFESFAQNELEALHQLLDKLNQKSDSAGNLDQAIDNIKQMLDAHLDEVKQDTSDMADIAKESREMIDATSKLPEGQKKDELVEMLIQREEMPGGTDWEAFQKQVLQLELERRKGFNDYIDEIAAAIKDGDIIELESFLEQAMIDDAEARQCDDGNCEDDDCFNCGEELDGDAEDEDEEFDENKVASVLKKMQQPYIETDEEEEDEDEDDEEDNEDELPKPAKSRKK